MKNFKTTIVAALCAIWPLASSATQNTSDMTTPQMKRAKKVVFDEVKTNADNTATAVAILTYEDGTKAKCRYIMRYEPATEGGEQGVRFTPQSEQCAALK